MQNEVTPDWMIEQGFSITFAKRFWSHVQIGDSCWLWTAGCTPDGYGKIGGGKKENGKWRHVRAHRAAWMLCRGPIPNGLQALHNCPITDNPVCVNPEHLWLGTNLENMADGRKKNQFVKGEEQHLAKLTSRKVIKIRAMYSSGLYSQQVIADRFGVAQSVVSAAILGQTWKHILPRAPAQGRP